MTERDKEIQKLKKYAGKTLDNDIDKFLAEDIGSGDFTSAALISDEKARAVITVKQSCVVAGLEEAKNVFEKLGLAVTFLGSDGDAVEKKQNVMQIEGSARSILSGERLALNFLMRMSGIATTTHIIVESCKKINPQIKIAGTRKTTPGFRYYEKKAIILGGGEPHRWNLSDEILIKDNHLTIVKSVEKAVKLAKERNPDKNVEVEVETIGEAMEAVSADADVIMLDNFTPRDANAVYEKIKNKNPETIVEVSGGITKETAADYANCADIISLGSLTHSVQARDFSLKIIEVFHEQK
jgi:nicotinate-nucleotide pyrophosphorylase (carboxylating)